MLIRRCVELVVAVVIGEGSGFSFFLVALIYPLVSIGCKARDEFGRGMSLVDAVPGGDDGEGRALVVEAVTGYGSRHFIEWIELMRPD